MKTPKQFCRMRKDLSEEFPDGFKSNNAFIDPNEKYQYRWKHWDSGFQILQNDKWINAYSIDFDF